MPRAYTKSGSIEKYESAEWATPVWTGSATGTITGPDNNGNYTVNAPSGYSSGGSDISCTTKYGGVSKVFWFSLPTYYLSMFIEVLEYGGRNINTIKAMTGNVAGGGGKNVWPEMSFSVNVELIVKGNSVFDSVSVNIPNNTSSGQVVGRTYTSYPYTEIINIKSANTFYKKYKVVVRY